MTSEVSHSNSYIDDNQYASFLMENKIKKLGGEHSYQTSLDIVG